jgi:hypothetical protein
VAFGLLGCRGAVGCYGTVKPGVAPGGSWPALVGIRYV